MKTRVIILLLLFMITACGTHNPADPQYGDIDFRQEMRNFVRKISQVARGTDEDFIIIPQNGQEIITQDGEPDGRLMTDYIAAIDGSGREDLFYGYDTDNEPTQESEKEYLIAWCDLYEQNGIEVLVTDYCSSHDRMDNSYLLNHARDYTSFAAPDRELNRIPDYPSQPFQINNQDISILSEAKNFLYLINPENFSSKQAFIDAVSATNYDLIIMDAFFEETVWTAGEITQLKTKKNGGQRLVVAYMSIGEAEDYRYYWQEDWENDPPDWLDDENPQWEGNYKVRYWLDSWQNIICGDDQSYLKILLDAGFDGTYLDIIDAFEHFE